MPKQHLLIVEDSAEYVRMLERTLGEKFSIHGAATKGSALDRLGRGRFDAVLLDIRLDASDEANQEGLEVLEFISGEGLDLPVVVMTAFETPEMVDAALRRGAEDFVNKAHSSPDEIEKRVSFAIQRRDERRRAEALEERLEHLEPHEIVGTSSEIERARSLVEMVANNPEATVLVRGETGTGKRLVGRAVHATGDRSRGPLVVVDLLSAPADDHARILFGERSGTGRGAAAAGAFRRASGGILVIHEIGQASEGAQGGLLKALAQGRVSPVGGGRDIHVDVQVVSTSTEDLERKVASGDLRKDLYYRLGTVEIWLPPLRERTEDIKALASHFVERYGRAGQPEVVGLSAEAITELERCQWPGNVLQLQSAISAAVMAARDEGAREVALRHIPASVFGVRPAPVSASDLLVLPQDGCDVDERKAYVELQLITQAIEQQNGNKAHAWRLLGYNDRKMLYRRLAAIRRRYPHLMASPGP